MAALLTMRDGELITAGVPHPEEPRPWRGVSKDESPGIGNTSVLFSWCCLERQRLDKWLWHARVVRARSSAAALVEAGHVRINGVREQAPSHAVKAGDVLTISLDNSVRVLKVVGFAERRGDASAARVLYDDLQARRE